MMIAILITYVIIGIPWLILGLVAYWEEPDREAATLLVTAPIWPVALVVFVVRMFLAALATLQGEEQR